MWFCRPTWFNRSRALTLCLACLSVLARDLPADNLRESTSLKFVPADASFYTAVLRNGEQVDAFLKSNAYQKLRNLPLLTFGLGMLEGQWQGPNFDQLRVAAKELWEQEENQQLARLLKDAFSQEVFVYGDVRYAEMIKLGQELQRAVRAVQIRAARNPDSSEDAAQDLLKSALKELSQFKMPGTLVGFRVSDAAAAEAQIGRLEKFLREVIEQQAELQPLKDRLTRQKIGGKSFLTLSLDGSLIPWDEIPAEAREKVTEEMRDALSKLKLTISLGVKDGYVLLSVGESNEQIKQMGQGKLLIDLPEMNALRKHSDRRIVSIGYSSKNLMEQANSGASQIDDALASAETIVPLAQLGENATATLLTDIRQLASELKKFIPKPGSVASFAFLTDHGYEGYKYDWGEHSGLNGSEQLGILDHVGGNPIAFFAARGKYSPDTYDWCVKWLSKAWHHVEQNVVPKLNDEQRQHFEKVSEHTLPLLARFDKVTRNDLVPALRDGQGAFVLDLKAQSKQWHRQLPTTRVPLPMLEIAFVYGVSDSAALKRAASEYFAITQEALNVAHELADDKSVPKVELPSPELTKTDVGEIYSYTIPEPLGLDAQIAPNAGLSKDTLVLSMMPDLTKRLLQTTPLNRVWPLTKSDRPLASASYFNVAGFLDAVTPWINYGVRIAGQAQGDDNPQARMAMQMVAGNVTPIVELLKCFGENASVTYIEDDAVVTHSATHFADPK